MSNKNPYEIIRQLRVTEKAVVLENLKNASSNKSVSKFKLPKYVFDVAPKATKTDIKAALEEIYPNVKVTKVNTINVKPKMRRVRGRVGYTTGFKKAVVTLSEGDTIESA
jgi:large subunit ribosomal protein L23